MALEEEPSGAAQELRRAIDCLESSVDLKNMPAAALQALAAGAVHFSLPAGEVLFESGSSPEGVYLLASGRLAVRAGGGGALIAEIERGELVGETGWLLGEPRSATVIALRDSELVLLPQAVLEAAAARSSEFSLALARLCARRLRRSNAAKASARRARVFALVPNSEEIDAIEFATRLVGELARVGRTELVWDVRAIRHTSAWFGRLEEQNDYVLYAADPSDSGWTRQCCRQADLILALARADAQPRPWAQSLCGAAERGARIDLALLHENGFAAGHTGRWLRSLRPAQHHHILDAEDLGRVARLLTHRGVGLVLSGGGARGFAHLGVIRALREARVPIDFVGGASIGSIIAAGLAMGWSDEEMRMRYRRSFVDTNPVNDYTFPLVALTRGRKVSRLLAREYGDVLIEDLRRPFFCISANLTTGRTLEHREGLLWQVLRAAVAIPGVMPPVFQGQDVLVDGAALNNLPVDVMHRQAPGLVIGCDAGADHSFPAQAPGRDAPPLWRFFARRRNGERRINIFQILMHAGMVNSVSSSAAQRMLADLVLKPPLANIDLLEWHAFDRAIDAGYDYARHALAQLPQLPRLAATPGTKPAPSSLATEIERRLAAGALSKQST
ncbi:MAG TPA: patatin-like phospholipase family protein [Steroidobacteraceae bacterium]|nr:patatin-like phospholipase family protein [Steroidobacteraceae bacterium]